jgi:hypothetical protein
VQMAVFAAMPSASGSLLRATETRRSGIVL